MRIPNSGFHTLLYYSYYSSPFQSSVFLRTINSKFRCYPLKYGINLIFNLQKSGYVIFNSTTIAFNWLFKSKLKYTLIFQRKRKEEDQLKLEKEHYSALYNNRQKQLLGRHLQRSKRRQHRLFYLEPTGKLFPYLLIHIIHPFL